MHRAVTLSLAWLSLSTLLPVAVTGAQQDVDRSHGYAERTVVLEDGPLAGHEARYRLLVPKNRRLGEKFPVVLFLHGAGERGEDNLAQLRHFPERMARGEAPKSWRALVIAPQVPRGERWVDVDWGKREPQTGPSPWLDVALAALDKTLAEEQADPQRIYLTGLSMGGFGAWHLAAKAPQRFAAVVPICGGGDPATAAALADVPIWAWHGAEDHVVHPDQTRRMVDAALAAGGHVLYTELPFTAHGSWSAAYAPESGVLDWMFARRRDRPDLGVVMACDQGGGSLRLLDVQRKDWDDPRAELWSWSPGQAELPDGHAEWFGAPTDAKPVFRGTSLLGTASGGAVFQVRLADRRLLWYARAGANPHSATWIPGRGAVVASSTDDRLAWFRIGERPDAEPLQVLELADAHGVHWDAASETLWALGGDELQRLTFEGDQLVLAARHPLAETPSRGATTGPGGHDLIGLRDGRLALSQLDRLRTFDPSAAAFAPFAPAVDVAAVKSLAELRPGGPWLLLAADEQWWSDTGRLIGLPDSRGPGTDDPATDDPNAVQVPNALRDIPDPGVRTRTGSRFYKLRAWQ